MDPGGKRSVAGPAHEWPRSPHTRPLAPGRFDQEHRVGGVILLASEARNGRPSRRRTPETYPAGPRGRLPACARAHAGEPCGVGQVGTRRAPGPVPDRVPRAPSVRSRYRPIVRPVARFTTPGLGHQEDGSEPPSPPMRAELPDRAKLHHGKSHCTLAPGPPPRCLLSPMPFPAPAPSSRGVGSRRPSGAAPSQCGCGWL